MRLVDFFLELKQTTFEKEKPSTYPILVFNCSAQQTYHSYFYVSYVLKYV